MQTVERVIINASPAAIWQVLADVERWPTWTPTVLEVEPLTSNGAKNGLKVGARYRVVQPKLRPAVYEVTECAPHQAFTWIQNHRRLRPHRSPQPETALRIPRRRKNRVSLLEFAR